MKVHEYQAKRILQKYGVAVPEGEPAETPERAEQIARGLEGPVWVVKAQVHAGGRGKGRLREEASEPILEQVLQGREDLPGAGGVRLARSPDQVREHALAMLGRTLVTRQTGRSGTPIRRIYVEQGCRIARELYLAVLLDRSRHQVVVMASTEGGTEIEEVAAARPHKILKEWIDPTVGFGAWQARRLAFGLGLEGRTVRGFVRLVQGLVRAFHQTDASLAEINPLVVTDEGQVMALDGKMTFDDNAAFRHPELQGLRDTAEEDRTELEASRHDLSYVKLDGDIGCMVNGAGLAMATMDIIKLYGGEPANFLDVGGGASREKVVAAFKIITRDPNVSAILVNIFGGIMKCDVIAEGVVAAVQDVGLEVPLVIRLEGTNVERGRAIIRESGLEVTTADSMADAAQKVVAAAEGNQP